jgi:hypothetical protein
MTITDEMVTEFGDMSDPTLGARIDAAAKAAVHQACLKRCAEKTAARIEAIRREVAWEKTRAARFSTRSNAKRGEDGLFYHPLEFLAYMADRGFFYQRSTDRWFFTG